jgi:hypothetical protein
VGIANRLHFQGPWKAFFVELRVSPGARDRPDVYQVGDLVRFQQTHKTFDRARGVADGVNPPWKLTHAILLRIVSLSADTALEIFRFEWTRLSDQFPGSLDLIPYIP